MKPTPSQNVWPETTWKPTPINIKNLENAGHVAEKSPGFLYPAAVLRRPSSQVSGFVSKCEPTLGPCRGFPSCNDNRTVSNLLTYHWELESWTKQETVPQTRNSRQCGGSRARVPPAKVSTHTNLMTPLLSAFRRFTLQLQAEEPMNILAATRLWSVWQGTKKEGATQKKFHSCWMIPLSLSTTHWRTQEVRFHN